MHYVANPDLPFVEPFQPVQTAEHRGLAAARRAENGRELRLGDAERGAIQHGVAPYRLTTLVTSITLGRKI